MFKPQYTLENLSFGNDKTIANHLGIEMVELGKDYLIARMPVDHRTHQPFGILHGGASVVLAETVGSLAAYICLDPEKAQQAVGLEINANHIRPVASGWVYGKATPIHIGKSTHVWEIKITNEEDKLVCICRLTMAILGK